MFTYIKLKNFKSFGDVIFDFRANKKKAKSFAAIYGENGCGKSNFVTAFRFLLNSINSLTEIMKRESTIALIDKKVDEANPENVNVLMKDLLKHFKGVFSAEELSTAMKKTRRIGCADPTEIEYGFLLNGAEGYYRIKYSDVLLEEELYHIVNQNRGTLFKIRNVDAVIEKDTKRVFQSDDYRNEVSGLIEKFWGKHTLLSILVNEQENKNKEFILRNVNHNILKVIDLFEATTIICRDSANNTTGRICCKSGWLEDLEKGEISKEDESLLDRIECILYEFFTQAYADIKNVYYKRKKDNDVIEYRLYFKKMIAGELTDVPASKESAGTQKILHNMTALLGATQGITVIIDEIDNGIHDILMKNIIKSILGEIEGQLIITTHNTFLLEEISAKNAYVISSDFEGNKEANCFADYTRVQRTNNLRELYNKGVFGGIPYDNEIDFLAIKQQLD